MSHNKRIYWTVIAFMSEEIWKRDCKWNKLVSDWRKAAGV